MPDLMPSPIQLLPKCGTHWCQSRAGVLGLCRCCYRREWVARKRAAAREGRIVPTIGRPKTNVLPCACGAASAVRGMCKRCYGRLYERERAPTLRSFPMDEAYEILCEAANLERLDLARYILDTRAKHFDPRHKDWIHYRVFATA